MRRLVQKVRRKGHLFNLCRECREDKGTDKKFKEVIKRKTIEGMKGITKKESVSICSRCELEESCKKILPVKRIMVINENEICKEFQKKVSDTLKKEIEELDSIIKLIKDLREDARKLVVAYNRMHMELLSMRIKLIQE